MQTIRGRNKTLICLNFLTDEEKDLLKERWKEHFKKCSQDAVIIDIGRKNDCNNCNSDDVFDKIEGTFEEMGIDNISTNVILSVFSEPSDEISSILRDLKNGLPDVLSAQIERVFWFQYVGKISRLNSDEKKRISEAVLKNYIGEIVTLLTAKRGLAGKNELWKAELLLLDIYCRENDGLTQSFITNSFGFLGYCSSQEKKSTEYDKEIEKIQKQINSEDPSVFGRAVKQYFDEEIASRIKKFSSPTIGMLPIHLENGTIQWEEVEESLNETINIISDRIELFFEDLKLDEIFEKLLDKSQVGICALRSKDGFLKGIPEVSVSSHPSSLYLNKKCKNSEIHNEIYQYLMGSVKEIEKYTEEKFYKKIRDKCSDYLTESVISEKEGLLKNRMCDLQNRRNTIFNGEELIKKIKQQKNNVFKKAFTPKNQTVRCNEEKIVLLPQSKYDKDGGIDRTFWFSSEMNLKDVVGLSIFSYSMSNKEDKENVVNDLFGIG